MVVLSFFYFSHIFFLLFFTGGDFFSVRLTGVAPMSISNDDTKCMSEMDLRLGTVKHLGWIHSIPQAHNCISEITKASMTNDYSSSTDFVDLDGIIIKPEGMLVTASEGWYNSHPTPGDDSTYNGSYVPFVAGRFHLDVLLTVVPDTSNGSTSYAIGPGLARATSSIEASFTIQARDMYNNPQIHNQDSFYVVATRGPSTGALAQPLQSVYSGEKQPQFKASSIEHIPGTQGQYRVKYTPTDAGTFLLRVSLLLPEQAHDDYGLSEVLSTMDSVKSELSGSPFVVQVSDGAVTSSTSHAYGIGLSHATAGVAAYFTVQARDAAGNNRTTGGDALTVSVLHETTSHQYDSIKIRYIVNGSYRVHYNATIKGNTTVNVRINNMHINGSPFRPYVSPTVAYSLTSHADGIGLISSISSGSLGSLSPVSNITVYARDRYNNLLNRGGDQFLVKLVGPTQLYVRLQDLGGGVYYSEYIPSFLSGQYDLSIHLLKSYMNGGGGLKGQFYHDHSYKKVAMERIDPTVDTAIAPIFKSVRYSGFVVPVGTGPYHFEVRTKNVLPRLRVNGIQIIDVREGFDIGSSRNGTVPLIGGIPYEIILELAMFKMDISSVQLLWSGAGLPGIDSMMRIVPKSRLAPYGEPIKGSPFRVNIN
jgi:hypothetical protein